MYNISLFFGETRGSWIHRDVQVEIKRIVIAVMFNERSDDDRTYTTTAEIH